MNKLSDYKWLVWFYFTQYSISEAVVVDPDKKKASYQHSNFRAAHIYTDLYFSVAFQIEPCRYDPPSGVQALLLATYSCSNAI